MKFEISKNPADFQEEIAHKLKLIRKDSGFSQSELAERSGVSLGSLKRFESSGQISFESLLKLAQILNRLNDFENLFNEDQNLIEAEKLFSDKTRRK